MSTIRHKAITKSTKFGRFLSCSSQPYDASTQKPLDVSYVYPHWVSTLGKDSRFTAYLPVNQTALVLIYIHFTSLNAFWRFTTTVVRRFVKIVYFGSAQKLLDGLVRQDVQMIEEEQQAYVIIQSVGVTS
jgi:hypothetical protein